MILQTLLKKSIISFISFNSAIQNGSVILLRHEFETLKSAYTVAMKRCISTQEITKNLYLITEDERKIVKDTKTLR